MSHPVRTVELDETDRALLRLLREDARTANNTLAAAVGIAPSTCIARVRRLRDAGVIRGYHADIDLAALGRPLQAIVAVRLQAHKRAVVDSFVASVARLPGVLSVLHTAGVDDYLVHVAAASPEALRTFILDHVTSHPAVRATQTSLIFESIPGRGPVAE